MDFNGCTQTSIDQTTVIRDATLQDCPAITQCAQRAYAIYVDRIGRKPAPMQADFASHIRKNQVIVVEVDDSVVAYAVFYPKHSSLFLENIAVHPDYHATGIGGQLLTHIEASAQVGGYDSVELYTNELMNENLLWYPKRGYVEVARRCEDGFKRVYFRKDTTR